MRSPNATALILFTTINKWPFFKSVKQSVKRRVKRHGPIGIHCDTPKMGPRPIPKRHGKRHQTSNL